MLREKAPRSIIATSKVFKPEKMEIWVFEESADLYQDESSSGMYESQESMMQSSVDGSQV